jgi:putative protein kinase ArgK-like GTPase of G3E family
MIKLRHIILEQSTNPKALILAGSPGAGKSSFIEGVKDAIILNVDDYYMRNSKRFKRIFRFKKRERRGQKQSSSSNGRCEQRIPTYDPRNHLR